MLQMAAVCFLKHSNRRASGPSEKKKTLLNTLALSHLSAVPSCKTVAVSGNHQPFRISLCDSEVMSNREKKPRLCLPWGCQAQKMLYAAAPGVPHLPWQTGLERCRKLQLPSVGILAPAQNTADPRLETSCTRTENWSVDCSHCSLFSIEGGERGGGGGGVPHVDSK